MSNKTLDAWLEAYNALEKEHDRRWDKLSKYEVEGNKERAAMTSKKMDEIDAEMKGMKKALEIFGYTVIYQDGINKVVIDHSDSQKKYECLSVITKVVDSI